MVPDKSYNKEIILGYILLLKLLFLLMNSSSFSKNCGCIHLHRTTFFLLLKQKVNCETTHTMQYTHNKQEIGWKHGNNIHTVHCGFTIYSSVMGELVNRKWRASSFTSWQCKLLNVWHGVSNITGGLCCLPSVRTLLIKCYLPKFIACTEYHALA